MDRRQAELFAHVHPAVEAERNIKRVEHEIVRSGIKIIELGGEPGFDHALFGLSEALKCSLPLPQSLEDHYFDLVETPVVEELEWLGPSRS